MHYISEGIKKEENAGFKRNEIRLDYKQNVTWNFRNVISFSP